MTCFYVPTELASLTDHLQTVGMMSDFYAGVLVAWQLDGIKFALGPTIATTRARLNGFGGYPELENRPADDLLVGRLIAEQGYEVVLLRYTIETVCDYASLRDLLLKRLRWIVVMRHMRPWGHLGLLLTQGLPWSLAAVAIHPSASVALGYLGAYLGLRIAMTWIIGMHGLRQSGLWKDMLLIPVWDAVAFAIWLTSFARNSIRWRGADYYIRNGRHQFQWLQLGWANKSGSASGEDSLTYPRARPFSQFTITFSAGSSSLLPRNSNMAWGNPGLETTVLRRTEPEHSSPAGDKRYSPSKARIRTSPTSGPHKAIALRPHESTAQGPYCWTVITPNRPLA